MKSPKCFLYESPRTELDKQPLLIKLLASENEYEGGLFQVIPTQPFRNLVEWENDMTQADYLILPVNYVVALQDINYLEGFFRTAKENNLKVLITNHGDYTEPIEVKNGVILKTSAYKDELQKNEIIIPAFVEDVGLQYTCTPRLKKSEVPTIGFSGMVQ